MRVYIAVAKSSGRYQAAGWYCIRGWINAGVAWRRRPWQAAKKVWTKRPCFVVGKHSTVPVRRARSTLHTHWIAVLPIVIASDPGRSLGRDLRCRLSRGVDRLQSMYMLCRSNRISFWTLAIYGNSLNRTRIDIDNHWSVHPAQGSWSRLGGEEFPVGEVPRTL